MSAERASRTGGACFFSSLSSFGKMMFREKEAWLFAILRSSCGKDIARKVTTVTYDRADQINVARPLSDSTGTECFTAAFKRIL
jgi:hypothetical protein